MLSGPNRARSEGGFDESFGGLVPPLPQPRRLVFPVFAGAAADSSLNATATGESAAHWLASPPGDNSAAHWLA